MVGENVTISSGSEIEAYKTEEKDFDYFIKLTRWFY